MSIGASVNSSNGIAGGGAAAINTILGNVEAYTQGVDATADAVNGGAPGNITVAASDSAAIAAEVVGVSAAVNFSPKSSNVVALGAAVAVNLIGWAGTVADETEDSDDPIIVSGTVTGGSLTAGGAVSVTAGSTASISATTAAVSVGIAISGGGGGGGSSSAGNGTSNGNPTNSNNDNTAQTEGEGSTPAPSNSGGSGGSGSGGTSASSPAPSDEGNANGTTVNEGSDNAGGSETSQAQDGGTSAGQAGNTTSKATGAGAGTTTSTSLGFGTSGGILIGLGGVISSAIASNPSPPKYQTAPDSGGVTEIRTVNNGDTVQLSQSYDTPTWYVNTSKNDIGPSSTVNTGDVVNDNGVLYRYIGNSPTTADFQSGATPPDFTNTAQWAQIGGDSGATYTYIGPSGTSVDLYNTDYTNSSLWQEGAGSTGGSGTSAAGTGTNGVLATLGAGLGFLTGTTTTTTPTKSASDPKKPADTATPPSTSNPSGSDTTPAQTPQGPTNPTTPSSTGATNANPKEAATPSSPTAQPSGESGSQNNTSNSGGTGGTGSNGSVGFSAAGVYTENKISASITAEVENTATITTHAGATGGLSVKATDSAQINSLDGAAAVTADLSGKASKSITIGIGIARNTIQDW